MKISIAVLFVCFLHLGFCAEIKSSLDTLNTDFNLDGSRDRRDVIEEEKFYNIRSDVRKENLPKPWIPGPLPPDDPTTRVSLTMGDEQKEQLFQTTERVTDKPTSRGARASNENWVKLPYPGRDEQERDSILTPPQPSGDLVNSRMPRINFVTQNKVLDTSESRNEKESIQRTSRNDDLRTEFVRPDQEPKTVKPVYPRQAIYYPEESRRAPYFPTDRYYPTDDFRRDPYLADDRSYDRRRYYPGLPRADRYDEPYDNYLSRKPKRIIYYAHLPEVVRTPPSVDLRYRYSVDPYRRFDDDYSARSGRYDYRFRNRYPYAPLRKEDRLYRDLAGAGTTNKEKKTEQKVTAAPVLPQKGDVRKTNDGRKQAKSVINSHQYHDTMDVHFNDHLIQKSFEDVVRPDNGYLRYDEPLFQGTVDDPYRQNYY